MQTLFASSPWSTPPIDSKVTQGYHLGALAQWLKSAGAEPRLALGLCSGPRARAKLYDHLTQAGVDIAAAPVTAERPIHPDLLGHQGTHFNSTLFVVGGFGKIDAADIFRILNGQRKQLNRTATWVLILVESTATLEALYTHAPALANEIMRRCVVIDAEVADVAQHPVSPALTDFWRRRGDIAESVFADVMNLQRGTDYFTFSRLVRSGYISQLTAITPLLNGERRALVEIWKTNRFEGDPPMTAAVAEAVMRHTTPTPAQRGRATEALAADPATRFAVGLDVSEDPFWGALASLQTAAAAGESSSPSAWARLRADAASLTLVERVVAEVSISRAAATNGDLEACLNALERAAEWSKVVAPEIRFDLFEKLAQLHAFVERPGPANAALTAMEAEVSGLCSPHFAGRAAFALARFFDGKDPTVSQRFFKRAAALFGDHGYPERARDASAAVEAAP